MRLITALITALLPFASIHAAPCCDKKDCYSEYFNAYIGTVFRQDQLDFSVANDPDGTVSPARRFQWEDLRILPFYGYADYRNQCGFVVKLYGDYGRIYDGSAHTREWNASGLTLREKGCAQRGSVWDLGGGIGYDFRFCKDLWTVTPFIGYDHNEQYYRIYDIQREFGPFQGLLDGRHHSYQTLWRGPWAGIQTRSGPWICDSLWVTLGYDWHYMIYRANLYDSLPVIGTNFTVRCTRKQSSDAYGNHFWAAIDYHCNKMWSIGLYSGFKDYKMKSGKQISSCNDASLERKVRFNGGDWQSFVFLITLGYHWPN